jgi:hypothetical protein
MNLFSKSTDTKLLRDYVGWEIEVSYMILRYLSSISAKDCVNVVLSCKKMRDDEVVKGNLSLWKSYTLVKKINTDIEFFKVKNRNSCFFITDPEITDHTFNSYFSTYPIYVDDKVNYHEFKRKEYRNKMAHRNFISIGAYSFEGTRHIKILNNWTSQLYVNAKVHGEEFFLKVIDYKYPSEITVEPIQVTRTEFRFIHE